MQCARLNLAERSRVRTCDARAGVLEPRRYCQKRLVNPEHDEDPRWTEAALERFRCDFISEQQPYEEECQQEVQNEVDGLYLSVLNLQFQGDSQENKRQRTCFKYKSENGTNKHRMFIKQTVSGNQLPYDDTSFSVDVDYYFDDYVNYIINKTEQSRPSTGRSSIYFQRKSNSIYKQKENKAVQVNSDDSILNSKNNNSSKKLSKPNTTVIKIDNGDYIKDSAMEDTKISYCNTGKRKSLTISRAQSPETVQVIRVDVVCNNSSAASVASASDEKYKTENKFSNKTNDNDDAKRNNFANKYLLTNTIKTLDENVGGGSKVTLLCKTFKLANRNNRHVDAKASHVFQEDHIIKEKRTAKKKINGHKNSNVINK